MTYDPVAFWDANAQHLAGPGAGSPDHERQETALEALLGRLKWESVLEVGVGGGRISALLRRLRSDASYTGIDIGAVQLAAGKRVWPQGRFEEVPIEDFDPDGRRWDLVVASEVLMHVTPERIGDAVRNVLAASRRHVVIVEWVASVVELEQPIAYWNFAHDYPTLFASVDPKMRLVSSDPTDRQVIYRLQR